MGERGVRNAEVEGSNPLPSTIRIHRRGAGSIRRPVLRSDDRRTYLAARAGFAGHILWYQTEPSFVWLPFFLIRSLHLGQVPIPFSLAT